jgi:hypothetical protein
VTPHPHDPPRPTLCCPVLSALAACRLGVEVGDRERREECKELKPRKPHAAYVARREAREVGA